MHTSAMAEPLPLCISAGTVLESVNKSLEAELSGRLDPVIKLARNLPPFSGNMLELHFDRSDAPFDFAFRINKQYDGPLLQPALHQDKIAPAVWKGYSQLFQTPKPGFQYGIENICFEYDFPFLTQPALFFDLHRDKAFSPGEAYVDLKEIASIFQYPVHKNLSVFLTDIKHLGLKVVYYGFMLSRKCQAIRLTIEGVKPAQFIETAITLGWKCNYDTLIKIQECYLRKDQRIVLCVDFDKRLGSKFGIEVHDMSVDVFLDKLFRNNICKENYFDLLKSWPGEKYINDSLSEALTNLYQRTINCIYRRINHFKFTVDKNTVKAKAYLYYCF